MSKKRYAAAFGAAGLVFAGVFGAAAALDVDGGNAQSGQSSDLSCDTDGVGVEGYMIEQDDNGPEPLSFGVKVTDVDTACDGLWVSARTLDSNGDVLGRGVAQINGNVVSVHYLSGHGGDNGVPVSAIETVSLAIT
ncbi:MAG: hypothetical protein GEU86_12690 [Actinophytocola sp.]|nr:hypothetical protein [Actinophytocola sp.]